MWKETFEKFLSFPEFNYGPFGFPYDQWRWRIKWNIGRKNFFHSVNAEHRMEISFSRTTKFIVLNSMVWVGNSWQFQVLCKMWKKTVKNFHFQVLMDLGVIMGADFKSASHFSVSLQEIWFLMVIMVFSGRRATAHGKIKPHMDNFPLGKSWWNMVWCTTNKSIKSVESNCWRR